MIIKTEKLEGTALDWAVAKCKGVDVFVQNPAGHSPWIGFYDGDFLPYTPSTDWIEGGPLVEKHEIHIAPMNGRKYPRWIAMLEDVDAFGATPLIAAMRAIVATKLGETVDVPEEIA